MRFIAVLLVVGSVSGQSGLSAFIDMCRVATVDDTDHAAAQCEFVNSFHEDEALLLDAVLEGCMHGGVEEWMQDLCGVAQTDINQPNTPDLGGGRTIAEIVKACETDGYARPAGDINYACIFVLPHQGDEISIRNTLTTGCAKPKPTKDWMRELCAALRK